MKSIILSLIVSSSSFLHLSNGLKNQPVIAQTQTATVATCWFTPNKQQLSQRPEELRPSDSVVRIKTGNTTVMTVCVAMKTQLQTVISCQLLCTIDATGGQIKHVLGWLFSTAGNLASWLMSRRGQRTCCKNVNKSCMAHRHRCFEWFGTIVTLVLRTPHSGWLGKHRLWGCWLASGHRWQKILVARKTLSSTVDK